MEALIITAFFLLAILGVQAQKWHSSYLKERAEEKKYFDVYVMNLEERKDYEMSQQGFIAFVRFLFLLSLTGSFIKELYRRGRIKLKLVKRYTINDVFYKSIKENKY